MSNARNPHSTATGPTPSPGSQCPECSGDLIDDGDHAETTCEECGLVVDSDKIDHGPEWRNYEGDQTDRSRVGAPRTELRHDRGLSTTIGNKDRDGNGTQLSPRKREKMNRLRAWDRRFRTRDGKDRNLRQALGEIDRMGSALGLPSNVRETAAVIYRRSLAEDLVFGRSIEGVASACLYASARQAGTPRSLDEVATVSRVEKGEIARTYRYVARELGLAVDLSSPTDYLGRYASELGVDNGLERRARQLLRDTEGTGVHVGKDPTGLAAGALYAAARIEGGGVTQSGVAEVADVCEVTVRNRYLDLLDAADVE